MGLQAPQAEGADSLWDALLNLDLQVVVGCVYAMHIFYIYTVHSTLKGHQKFAGVKKKRVHVLTHLESHTPKKFSTSASEGS